MSETVQRAIDAIIADTREEVDGWRDDYGHRCKSPIEEALLLSVLFVLTMGRVQWAVLSPDADKNPIISAHPSFVVIIEPQAPVRNYRADFLFSVVMNGAVSSRFVVECDGHKFHEKTKDQASRDKARDRLMQGLSLKVLRFTGSDIYKSAMNCAMEVLGAIEDSFMPPRSL